MTQSKFTRSEIKQWARSGQLTPERIAAIEAAQRSGNVSRDVSGVDVACPQPVTLDKQPPRAAGTEIAAQRIEPRVPKSWMLPR
jgi:hypothetical protein